MWISEEEIKCCCDLWEIIIIIVDFEDVKDFDDVLFICYLENGEIEVGVYIVDVMYYVKEGILLDKEVFNCFIFVYLVDWVFFMLLE